MMWHLSIPHFNKRGARGDLIFGENFEQQIPLDPPLTKGGVYPVPSIGAVVA
jgi:hypothetical protein